MNLPTLYVGGRWPDWGVPGRRDGKREFLRMGVTSSEGLCRAYALCVGTRIRRR